MSGIQQLLGGGGAAARIYSDDVFSTYLYTGNGSSQTITNGIDLSGDGGMVWVKGRNVASGHALFDTQRGAEYYLRSNATSAQGRDVGYGVTAFGSTGFTLIDTTAGDSGVNGSAAAQTYASWTFRKANKFFGVQTATLGTGNATVSFPELETLGMVAVKRTDAAGSWYVWHRSLTAGKLLLLESTAAEATLGQITVSGTTVTLVDGTLADGNYVVYAWAHDTGTDGIIQCGSFTTDGSGNATVNLGWEPQWVLTKKSDNTEDWRIYDVMRGLPTSGGDSMLLRPNLSNADTTNSPSFVSINASGFKYAQGTGSTYIYLAIRRPNKPPTSGTQVYSGATYTGDGSTPRVLTSPSFPPDLFLAQARGTGGKSWWDRLRGKNQRLLSTSTAAEVDNPDSVLSFNMTGVTVGTENLVNVASGSFVGQYFRRAPGVFDVVCVTTTSSTNERFSHNLGVAPELIISKQRNGTAGWPVYHAALGRSQYLMLSTTAAAATLSNGWGTSDPTTTDFGVNTTGASIWPNNVNEVAYLFATKAGISKVGSYTGNGSSQTIDCGFAAGARFILIKRTDSTGDWYVYDTARGINAGNDPHLSLNTTAAEVNTTDDIDSDNSGFIVNQNATTNLNVNTATYIFLAFA